MGKENITRISVCVSLYGGASAIWIANLIDLIFSFLHDPEYEFQVLTNHTTPLTEARNRLIAQIKGQEEKTGWVPDFVLWLDSDNLVEKNQVSRLISDNCDVVSALYFSRKPPCPPVALRSVPGKKVKAWCLDYRKNALQEVDAVGMGCCLMKWGVIEKVAGSHAHPFDYESFVDDSGKPTFLSEDIVFCDRIQEQGFKIFLDSSVVSGHIGGVVGEKDFERGKG